MLTRQRVRFIWRYLRGDAPWDSGIVPPEIVAWVEMAGRTPGRALDLGCGTGTTSLYLAGRGWQVVGADFAPNAIRRAQQKAHQSSTVRFYSADVSRPDFLAGEKPFDLLVDVGCLHILDTRQRSGYAANITRLSRPSAVFLLYAFLPGLSRDGRRRIGIDRDTLAALLGPAFEIERQVIGEEATTPRPSAWYTIVRK